MLVFASISNRNVRKDFRLVYKQWEGSGLSRKNFCKQQDLKYSWFMYHQKRMRCKKGQNTKLEKLDSGHWFERIETPENEQHIFCVVEYHYPDKSYFLFVAGIPVVLIKEIIVSCWHWTGSAITSATAGRPKCGKGFDALCGLVRECFAIWCFY